MRKLFPHASNTPAPSLLDEEILVEPLDLHGAGDTHAHPMLNHQVGQSVTVNKDGALRQVADEVDGWGRKLDAMTNTPLVAPKPTRLDAQSLEAGGRRSRAGIIDGDIASELGHECRCNMDDAKVR
jgi:hypothetical protein